MATIETSNTNLGNPVVYTVYGSDVMPATAINEFSALQLPAMWSGIRWISSTMARFPKAVYKRAGELSQPVTHPVTKLLTRKINEYTFPMQAWETWYHHAVIFGNGYLLVKRDQSYKPTGLYNVMPETVTPFRVLDGAAQGQWYLIQNRGNNAIVPASDMCHLPGLGFDGLMGYPIVLLMTEALELARNAQKFSAKYLRKGTQIQGSIEIPVTATKEQVQQIVDMLRNRHSGIDSDYSFAVLTGGAHLNNTTIPPQQSQLLESMKDSDVRICQILRIPPHLIYRTEGEKYNSIESQGLDAIRYSLGEWLEKSEQTLTSKLLTEAEQDAGLVVLYDTDAISRGDSNSRTDNLLKQLNGGIITANQARAALNMPALDEPEADKLRIPVSFPVANQIGQQPAQPAPAAARAPAPRHSLEPIRPVLRAACLRVDAKSDKAFACKEGKPADETTRYFNVFSGQQERYAAEALRPVADTLQALGLPALDVDRAASRYAAAVRLRAATGTVTSLEAIVEDVLTKGTNEAA